LDEKEHIKKIIDFRGIGAFKYKNMGRPCNKASLQMINQNPMIIGEWLKMFHRYFDNWENNRYYRLSTD
jgi:hypothetical protein